MLINIFFNLKRIFDDDDDFRRSNGSSFLIQNIIIKYTKVIYTNTIKI